MLTCQKPIGRDEITCRFGDIEYFFSQTEGDSTSSLHTGVMNTLRFCGLDR